MHCPLRIQLLSLSLFVLLCSSTGMAQGKKQAKQFQKKLNQQFRDPEDSPLTEEDRAHFKRLEFYPIEPKFRVEAKWVRTPKEDTFAMPTSDPNRQKPYLKYGELHFQLEGRDMQLNVYQNQKLIQQEEYKNHLFIPFRDLTTGNDSYGGGRYIDWEIPVDGEPVILDFNQCYNPYCAYSTGWSCPIPPEENDLEVRIEAGVKNWDH